MKDQQVTQLSILGVVSIVGLIAAVGLLSTPIPTTPMMGVSGGQDTVTGQFALFSEEDRTTSIAGAPDDFAQDAPSQQEHDFSDPLGINEEQPVEEDTEQVSEEVQEIRSLTETREGGVTRVVEQEGTFYLQNTFASNFERISIENAKGKIESVCSQQGSEIKTKINYERPSGQLETQYESVQEVESLDSQGLTGENVAQSTCELDESLEGLNNLIDRNEFDVDEEQHTAYFRCFLEERSTQEPFVGGEITAEDQQAIDTCYRQYLADTKQSISEEERNSISQDIKNVLDTYQTVKRTETSTGYELLSTSVSEDLQTARNQAEQKIRKVCARDTARTPFSSRQIDEIEIYKTDDGFQVDARCHITVYDKHTDEEQKSVEESEDELEELDPVESPSFTN